ncbi:MAG: hypothetical protein KatS3mg102_0785 [Planctomycetota bacterium]|nr:MAG: hypothetical protein KatS3mg102_0785 [Planctomycetota bacterium]
MSAAPRVGSAEQFAGALLGQCLGDALGLPVEGHTPEVCAAYVEGLRAGRRRGGGRHPFGQISDDSQLARELLVSWVERHAFDPADYARRIARLFAEQRIVGYGRSTRRAALRLLAGVPWEQAGEPPPLAGNGGAMRAAPVGLMCAGDFERLAEVAITQCRITHADPRACAGAVAIAGATALALERGPLEPGRFVARLLPWVARAEAGFAAELERLPALLEQQPPEAARQLARAGLPPGSAPDWPGISPFVLPSVLWSLYCFLRAPDDWLAAVHTAIAAGGDTDTTAAMTGALAGARLGRGALPPSELALVQDRGGWREAELGALAELAWRLVYPVAGRQDAAADYSARS